MKIYTFILAFSITLTSYSQTEKNIADSIFEMPVISASFPGGDNAWRMYLVRNCNGNIGADNYAPPGTYTVVVQFIVGKDGEINDIKALTNHGFGFEDEVVRVISKGPKWIPATMNGKPVKAYRKQPVTFQVMAEFELSKYTLSVGKSNSIEIKVDDIKPEDIEVALSAGTIVHDIGNMYTVTVDKPGKVLLTVWKLIKKKKEEVGKVMLEVK